jgi:hypothetical protein
MTRIFLFIACCLFFVHASPAQNYVTIFQDCGYKGKSYYLEPGNYRLYQMKIENDKLSGIKIPAGMKVTLYEHDNFGGRSKTFSGHVSCLDVTWNDKTSSIVVEGSYRQGNNTNNYIVFYNDCYSKGYSRSLLPGTYTGSQLGILKNNISSFNIVGNLRLRAYLSSDNASGYSVTFDADQSCLTRSYNDKIRSLVIEYRQGGNYDGNQGGNQGGYGGNNYATIYTECSYRGNSMRLVPGYYQGDKLGLFRYDISSLKLPSNLRAKVFINNEYLSGNYYTLNANSSCLSSTMNNRIGSLIIEEKGYNNNTGGNYTPDVSQRVIIYTDTEYRGQSVSLLPGTYSNMAQIGFPDDALSSLSVPVGYRVVIYEHPNFGGKKYTITSSKNRFYISGWNDKTSSIAVYRDQ